MIERVMNSFAEHASAEARLVFKMHPLDHGIERHDIVIERLAGRLGLKDRIAVIETGELAAMLDCATGAITTNSTAGLAALGRDRPTMALGSAIYNLPGLTHQTGLDAFWTSPTAPDARLYAAFRRTVIARTQINGGYSSRRGAALAAPAVSERLLDP